MLCLPEVSPSFPLRGLLRGYSKVVLVMWENGCVCTINSSTGIMCPSLCHVFGRIGVEPEGALLKT